MGRFGKKILEKNGIDRRESGYYSTPKFISEFLTNEMLRINPNGTEVLDPAVGNEELCESFFLAGKQIDSFDIFPHEDYRFTNFTKQDFIEFYVEKKTNLFFKDSISLKYDYYIANPPYNCHEVDYIKSNKERLKPIFKRVGLHNMYSMFLSAIIDCAKEGALIGVIISDSFLTATMHSGLREQILSDCSIHNLSLCPNDLFRSQKADVRTCILILQKGKKHQSLVNVSNRPSNTAELENILSKKVFNQISIRDLILSPKKPANQFIVDVDSSILKLFKNKRLGEQFKCITGISTGNDSKYLSKTKKDGFSVPFYKNPGSRKFIMEPDAFLINHFMEESLIVKDFMVRNKPYALKEGITCSSMGLPFGACYLPEGSTYGVNANIFCDKSEDLHWLLSFMNSSLVTYLVRGVLLRSNMVTSGYISQIPIPEFSEKEKEKLAGISNAVIDNKETTSNALKEIDQIVFHNLALKKDVVNQILDFAENLDKRV